MNMNTTIATKLTALTLIGALAMGSTSCAAGSENTDPEAKSVGQATAAPSISNLNTVSTSTGVGGNLGALFVVALVLRVAWQLLRRNTAVLLDAAAVDAERIRALALQHDAVCGCHRIRSRGPAEAAHVDLHLVVRGDPRLSTAHAVGHDVEANICSALPGVLEVTVHLEPEGEVAEPL